MEIQVHYDDKADRLEQVAECEAQGLRMLRDHFDPGFDRAKMYGYFTTKLGEQGAVQVWVPGEEPSGTMTFTDVPEVQI